MVALYYTGELFYHKVQQEATPVYNVTMTTGWHDTLCSSWDIILCPRLVQIHETIKTSINMFEKASAEVKFD